MPKVKLGTWMLCGALTLAGIAEGQGFTADAQTTVSRILRDQKTDFVTFPSELAHGKHRLPVLAISAATAGLVIADQHDAPYFRRTSSFNSFNSAFSSTGTALGVAAVPLALYAFGHFEQDTYAKQSAMLTTEAAVDAEIAGELVKFAAERARPETMNPQANFGDSFGDSKSKLDPGFPSSHSIAAFSVATVLSDRYGHRHRWVPLVSYGLAAAVGFSRISSSAHYPADVFLGAALGYTIGHFTVMGGGQPVSLH